MQATGQTSLQATLQTARVVLTVIHVGGRRVCGQSIGECFVMLGSQDDAFLQRIRVAAQKFRWCLLVYEYKYICGGLEPEGQISR